MSKEQQKAAAVSVLNAKTHLSRLLVRVERGEETVIARNGVPVARLVPYRKPAKRQFGALKGRLVVPDSFFDPLPEAELAAWEGQAGAAVPRDA